MGEDAKRLQERLSPLTANAVDAARSSANVRFGGHNGLKPDIAPCPKSGQYQKWQVRDTVSRYGCFCDLLRPYSTVGLNVDVGIDQTQGTSPLSPVPDFPAPGKARMQPYRDILIADDWPADRATLIAKLRLTAKLVSRSG